MRMKKYIVFGFIVVMLAMLTGCNSKEADNVENNINKDEKVKDYKSLWDISMFYRNNTWKYTNEHIDCELYEWEELGAFPVPMIEGGKKLSVIENVLYLFDITKEEWDSYVDQIKDNYYTITEETNDYFGVTSYMYIYNTEYNYYMSITWNEEIPRINAKNCVSVYTYIGCQEKSSELTNEEVLAMVKEELGKRENEYTILNVSSETNIKDGFGVYYIGTDEEFDYGNNYSYLCVVEGKDIVALEPNVNLLGLTEAVEFLEVEGNWKMYAISHTAFRWHTSGDNSPIFLEFEMQDGKFVLKSENSIYKLKDFEGVYNVTIKKNGEKIEVYELIMDEEIYTDGSIPIYEEYSLGEIVGIIDGSEMETIELDY